MVNVNKSFFLVLMIAGFYLTSFAQNESAGMKKLTQRADVILTGKVIQKHSSWNETKTRINTKTTVQVEEYLKGKGNGNSVEITCPGGEVGEVGELYTHMPKFENNEQVLVFLKKDQKKKGYKVLNGEEGKITLQSDAKTNEKVTKSKVRIMDLKSKIKSYLEGQ